MTISHKTLLLRRLSVSGLIRSQSRSVSRKTRLSRHTRAAYILKQLKSRQNSSLVWMCVPILAVLTLRLN